MELLIYFLIMSYILRLIMADLRSCEEKYEKLELCFKGNKGYSNPLPINVSTDLYLKEITEIGEHDNSISIQLEMWTLWMDHGLGLSNDSSK